MTIPKRIETMEVPMTERVISQKYEVPAQGLYWLIAELDEKQELAFGYVSLSQSWKDISLEELRSLGAELTKDWEPKPFRRCQREAADLVWVRQLQAEGKTVIDGGSRTVKGLQSIHKIKGLSHLGFGFFENNTHRYNRVDSPIGTRFYTQSAK